MYLCWRSSGDDLLLALATGNLAIPSKHIQSRSPLLQWLPGLVLEQSAAGALSFKRPPFEKRFCFRTSHRGIQAHIPHYHIMAPAPPPLSDNQQLFLDHIHSLSDFPQYAPLTPSRPCCISTLILPNAMRCNASRSGQSQQFFNMHLSISPARPRNFPAATPSLRTFAFLIFA